MRQLGILLLASWCLAGCTSSEVLVAHSVPLASTKTQIPEPELLDIGVRIFDPGVPEGEVDKEVLEQLIKQGTFVQIRRTESLYMAVVLRNTLQKSRAWGTVWITPKDTTAADLSVNAKILQSDGDIFRLRVTAVDATGRKWIDKNYEMSTAAGAFNRQRYPDLDPYQDVFNEIANDLVAARDKLSADDRRNIRTVAGMRYAADMSPEAFNGYVAENRNGTYVVNRLPADGDPMFDRTQRVRQRERLFLETLDQHYDKFATDALSPYDSWREYSREESIEVREVTKTARWRTGMGVATILASIVYGSSHNDTFSERVLSDAALYMGMEMIRISQLRRQEKRLHSETLEELSTSFEDQIKPMVVEVQGTQHRLTGTADAQYQEWRDLLRRMFATESGFTPEEVAIYNEPETPPAVIEALPQFPTLPTQEQAQPAPEQAEPATEEAPPEAVSDAVASSTSGV